MSISLSSILFKDYRRRVLGLLLLHPDKPYHVREIARLTGTVAGTLHKELARLAAAGILTKETSGNQVLYGADPNCPIYSELASILRKTSGIADVLRESLAPVVDRIEFAFVFGSMATGEETSGSDVDVMLIGDISFSEAVNALYSAQESIHREINPKVYSHGEWKKLVKSKDAFIKNVLAAPKIFLTGGPDDLR